jgi:hypothetical protein
MSNRCDISPDLYTGVLLRGADLKKRLREGWNMIRTG